MKRGRLTIFVPVILCLLSGCSKEASKAPTEDSSKNTVPSADPAKIAALKAVVPPEGSAFYDLSFDDARVKAQAESKSVMVDFYTTWCAPCKQLDKTTFKDEEVVKWLREKTVALKVDAEKQKDLAKRYRISAYPTIVFLKPDGTQTGQVTGYLKTKEFLSQAADALAGISRADRIKGEMTSDGGDDPLKRQALGDALTREGKHEEALGHYLWCFDHGNEHAGYGGVRLSFLLSKIGALGRNYPPALAALRERRDKATDAVVSGKGTFEQAMELNAINRQLGENGRTLEVYDKLAQGADAQDNELRAPMFNEVLDLLLDAERYQDVISGAGNIDLAVDQRILDYRRTAESFKDQENSPADYMRRLVIEEGGKYYQALLGLKEADKAAKLADKLIEFDSTGETFATLIHRAVRAGEPAMAKLLAVRGQATLPEPQRQLVQRAAEEIR